MVTDIAPQTEELTQADEEGYGRQAVFTLRLPAKVWEAVKLAAKHNHQSVNSWALRHLVRHAGFELDEIARDLLGDNGETEREASQLCQKYFAEETKIGRLEFDYSPFPTRPAAAAE